MKNRNQTFQNSIWRREIKNNTTSFLYFRIMRMFRHL